MADFTNPTHPIIRDSLVINDDIQGYYNSFNGSGPVFLIARSVTFKPEFVLKLSNYDLIIVADSFHGAGGAIDGGGALKGPLAQRGADGIDGQDATWHKVGYNKLRPSGPGGTGTSGQDGGSGHSGSNITLICRAAADVNLTSVGTPGADGGNAGRGGNGLGGVSPTFDADGNPNDDGFPGTCGGGAGRAGNGGDGGSGGAILFLTMAAVTSCVLTSAGASAGNGGRGNRAGRDGALCPQPDNPDNPDNPGEPRPSGSPPGNNGTPGANPAPVFEVVTREQYLAKVFEILGPYNYANHWAPFRLEMAEHFLRKFRPGVHDDADYGVLAAREIEATLELQYDNVEAARLKTLLVGVAVPDPVSREIVWMGGGSNALGLPRNLDLLPRFQDYLNAYTSFAPILLQFFTLGVGQILAAGQLDAVKSLLDGQQKIAQNALSDTAADLAIAKTEMKQATDEVDHLQKQLQQVTADIQAAIPTMTQSFSIGDVVGTVAAIGAAVVSVVAAIPTGGASLVALVPSVIALTKTVIDNATPLAQKFLEGDKTVDVKAVEDAYAKVNKQVTAVVNAGKAIVNFVDLINKLTAGTTPDNAQSVALVKRGAELTHQVLLARNQVILSQQRIDALLARQGRTQELIAWAEQKKTDLQPEEIRVAGFACIRMAQAKLDTLLSFAFLAQRSAEIYILKDESANVYLDAGRVSPDLYRSYYEGFITAGALMNELQDSWGKLLNPIQMQNDFLDYFRRFGSDQAIFRLSLTTPQQLQLLRDRKPVPFRIELSQLPQDHREARIRGVAVALVGAASPSSIATVELRHGGRYEQLLANPAPGQNPVFPQLLQPQVTSVSAPNKPLMLAGVQFGNDPTPDTPQLPALWGRGVAGDWEVRLPQIQPGGEIIDLSALTEIEVWIGYQFLHAS